MPFHMGCSVLLLVFIISPKPRTTSFWYQLFKSFYQPDSQILSEANTCHKTDQNTWKTKLEMGFLSCVHMILFWSRWPFESCGQSMLVSFFPSNVTSNFIQCVYLVRKKFLFAARKSLLLWSRTLALETSNAFNIPDQRLARRSKPTIFVHKPILILKLCQ